MICETCGQEIPEVKIVDINELEREIQSLENEIENELDIAPAMAIEYAKLFLGIDIKEQELINKKQELILEKMKIDELESIKVK